MNREDGFRNDIEKSFYGHWRNLEYQQNCQDEEFILGGFHNMFSNEEMDYHFQNIKPNFSQQV